MKKQMERTVYEAPVTERFSVELEGSFCGSAEIENPQSTETGRIDLQGVHEELNDFSSNNFSSEGWNSGF